MIYLTKYTVLWCVAVLWAELYLPPQLNKQHVTQYPALIHRSPQQHSVQTSQYKQPLTFYSISLTLMYRFAQKLQWIYMVSWQNKEASYIYDRSAWCFCKLLWKLTFLFVRCWLCFCYTVQNLKEIGECAAELRPKPILVWWSSAIFNLHFNQMPLFGVKICISLSNFIKIDWYFTDILAIWRYPKWRFSANLIYKFF